MYFLYQKDEVKMHIHMKIRTAEHLIISSRRRIAAELRQ
uniref:Uncharacterized protein n=1 Tax=Setaria italica TaxID=4555 RepID=K3Y496_SETIT